MRLKRQLTQSQVGMAQNGIWTTQISSWISVIVSRNVRHVARKKIFYVIAPIIMDDIQGPPEWLIWI
jgi:hypothetical protein